MAGCAGCVSRGQIIPIIAAKTDSAIITVGTALQTLGADLALIIISSIEPEPITTDLTASRAIANPAASGLLPTAIAQRITGIHEVVGLADQTHAILIAEGAAIVVLFAAAASPRVPVELPGAGVTVCAILAGEAAFRAGLALVAHLIEALVAYFAD